MPDVPLRDLMDVRIAALEKRIEDVDERAKEAIREARASSEAAQVRQNEWRSTVNDITSTKMDRSVSETVFGSISQRIDRLTSLVDSMQGKSSGIGSSVSIAISLAALASAVLLGLLHR